MANEIKIVPEVVKEIKDRYGNLAQRRLEHNTRLKMILEDLEKVKSDGFVEEIVEKLYRHVEDVDKNHFQNIVYSHDFLDNLVENLVEVDENILK